MCHSNMNCYNSVCVRQLFKVVALSGKDLDVLL
jgi:hypothetical protein